jgi:hypothetical protein
MLNLYIQSPSFILYYLTFAGASCSPPWFFAYAASLASGAPTPPRSKSPALRGLKKHTSVQIVQLHQELTKKMSGQPKKCNATYCPVLAFTPPSGISRFEPAPLAAEPYVTSAPGNFFSTLSSTPDSVAIRIIKLAKVHSTVAEPFCYSRSISPILCTEDDGRVRRWTDLLDVLAPLLASCPFLAASEPRSCSACLATLKGSVFLYSADMVIYVLYYKRFWFDEFK